MKKENNFNVLFNLMAFVPCTSAMEDNIAQPCDHPRIRGYEAIGIICNRQDVDFGASAVAADNPRIVTEFTLRTAAANDPPITPFCIYQSDNQPLPYEGTKTELQPDGTYKKTLQFYYKGIGGAKAKKVVEPLKNGEFVVILARKDKIGDGSFQMFGWQSGLKAVAQVQDDPATGYWLITMECIEPSAEVAFYKTDFATTLTAFNALQAAAPANS